MFKKFMDSGNSGGRAGFYRDLLAIVEGIEPTPNCVENSELVICTAYASRMFGARVIAEPRTGDFIQRLNKDGCVVESNWHQVTHFTENGIEYIVDLDSPETVYPIGRYRQECLLEPDNVIFREIQET